jgi:S1-C subfamily serine protease
VTPGTVGSVLAVDLVVGLLIVVAAGVGAWLGFMRALPIAGGAGGVLLASRVPLLLGEELDSDYALNIAIVAAIALGGIGAALGDAVARRATRAVRRRPLIAGRALWRRPVVDGGLGAILTAAAAAVVVWALAPPVAEISAARDDVQRSEVLDQFNAVLAPVRPPRDKSGRASESELLEGEPRPRRAPAEGETRLRDRPEVMAAERNLVKVTVERCGGGFQGTGWIAGPSVVVTNAHVVTAATKVTVSRSGQVRQLAATVVWFDGIHDLALLRVNALRDARGLPLAENPALSTPAISVGFPRGKLTIRRATVGPTTTQLGQLPPLQLAKTAGISLTMRERLVTMLRGVSAPGGSGTPVVDGRGRVVGTIFAGITQSNLTLAVPNRIVRSALMLAQHPVEVPPCKAPPLEPTPAESIAARNR